MTIQPSTQKSERAPSQAQDDSDVRQNQTMKFRVLIQGENFLLSNDEAEPKKYGFYVTAHVEAASTQDAEALALSLLRDYKELRKRVGNSADDRPILRMDEIATITNWPDGVACPLSGLSLYEEV